MDEKDMGVVLALTREPGGRLKINLIQQVTIGELLAAADGLSQLAKNQSVVPMQPPAPAVESEE